MANDHVEVIAPREGVNDDVAHVVRWLVPDGGHVDADQVIVLLETTKATFDLVAPRDGYVFHLAAAGTDVVVGSAVALVSSASERPQHDIEQARPPDGVAPSGQIISKRARELMAQHHLPLSHFEGLSAVREADVVAVIEKLASGPSSAAVRSFGGEQLDPNADWDAILQTTEFGELQDLLKKLRRRMRARHNRHVPLGTLLYDRWDLARDNEFGEGTSVYDECLILGTVTLGKHCWVGPFTILDGSMAPLTIGDYVDIGSGTHIYTHNSIERALTGRRAPVFGNSTTIGSCCFIAPNVTIGAGTVLGDHSFVGAGSYVEGTFAPYSYVAGNPAKVVGTVEVHGDRARVRLFSSGRPGSGAAEKPQ